MTHRILAFTIGIFLLPHGLRAASSAATEKEYQQVRTIALRDARVQSAYRDADRRLDSKIIQIDPALESYVKSRQAAREGAPAPKPVPTKPFAQAKPVAKPTPKPVAKTAPAKPAPPKPAPAGSATHTVASGETLGGIAVKNHVTVSALKTANHIADERKLRVGQVLTIPGGKAAPATKKSDSIWSLRSN